MLDQSLLQPSLTQGELETGCREACRLQVASVCVVPHFLQRAVELLSGTETLPGTTLAFPHGAQSLAAKLAELDVAIGAGAKEVDAVVNISQVVSNEFVSVEREVASLTERVHEAGARIKLIFETCYLSRQQIIALCEICGRAQVDWVKTSTGFGTRGATAEDVRLMRRHSPPKVQVKASGGIRDLDLVLEFRKLGASRIGTSASGAILEQARTRLSL